MHKNDFVRKYSGLKEKAVSSTIKLLNDGATVPFIARYRKEISGGLDEVEISHVRDLVKKYDAVCTRQKSILSAIDSQGNLSYELKQAIESCFDSVKLEDLYLPFKQKRETRGERARKKGLEPLAKMIMSQRGGSPEGMAQRFLTNGLALVDAIDGAKDIMAEWMNENANLRDRLRKLFDRRSILHSKLVKGKAPLAEKYRDYFDFSERLDRCASHRFLALYRAEREGLLSIKARPDDQEAIHILNRFFVKGQDESSIIVADAARDAYKRLLRPSLENEFLNRTKDRADKEAIGVFTKNLKQLLLAPPLGAKRILAIDPGFRTGCKVVCIDEVGGLLTNATIYPHSPQKEISKARSKIAQMVQAYKIGAIAIGDGTAGRETEQLIKSIRFDRDLEVFIVREDGASIYSASSIARKEFPNYDVTVRGAVSIGRRLMDPLAELVKIDPKSVGVGQYQHEVNQNLLKDALDDVVVSSVNAVGVDVNTASSYLLSYVSGLSMSIAENIIRYRDENGRINSRSELRKVKRLGDKAFEQAAGFIRIRNGKNPLDNSSVHPESYKYVNQIAKQQAIALGELIGNSKVLDELKKSDYPEIDSYTFSDIITELKKPGRDPRKKAKVLEFDHRVKSIADLKPGMVLSGLVTNVTNFGAFVNIGIKENGLIHKSNLSDEYVEDPSKFISLHEHVEVEIIEIDISRKRIGMKPLK